MAIIIVSPSSQLANCETPACNEISTYEFVSYIGGYRKLYHYSCAYHRAIVFTGLTIQPEPASNSITLTDTNGRKGRIEWE